MENEKDLITYRFDNNKARIIGQIVSLPSDDTCIRINNTRYYYFYVDSLYTNTWKNNPLVVWTDAAGKAKFFDSKIYKLNSLVIIHGSLRTHFETTTLKNGQDLLEGNLYVDLERMHFYPFNRQLFKNNNIGLAIGQIQSYKIHKLSPTKYMMDTIIKVNQGKFDTFLKIGAKDKAMQQFMETNIGDTVGFKFKLDSRLNVKRVPIMFANAFYVCDKAERYYDESFQDLDNFRFPAESDLSEAQILEKLAEKQDAMDSFLKNYFPEQYDEFRPLAIIDIPPLPKLAEESAPALPQPAEQTEEVPAKEDNKNFDI